MKKNNNLNRGFTVIETLVAVSIFSISILALLSVLASSIADTNYAKSKLAASYLAQEGIEYIKNLRDTYVLYDATSAQVGWDAFNTKVAGGTYPSGTTVCAATNGCYANADGLNYADNTQPMIDITLPACSDSTCSNAPLLYESTTGKYNYTSGTNSGFTRKIKVVPVSLNEVKVTSTVFWTQGSGSRSVVFSDSFFNWVE